MTFTLADWFYEGVLTEGMCSPSTQSTSPSKAVESGGFTASRAKHAGGAGEGGFAISLPTLFEKSGAEGTYRRFKFEMLKIAREDQLPAFALRIDDRGAAEPTLRMLRREFAPPPGEPVPAKPRVREARRAKPRAS